MSDYSGRVPTTNHGTRAEWPVAPPQRDTEGAVQLLVSVPRSSSKHVDRLAANIARRLQVILSEDVEVHLWSEGAWQPVTPAEGI